MKKAPPEQTAGSVATEQMIRGCLVIVSDIGGLGEVVGERGLIGGAAIARALSLFHARTHGR